MRHRIRASLYTVQRHTTHTRIIRSFTYIYIYTRTQCTHSGTFVSIVGHRLHSYRLRTSGVRPWASFGSKLPLVIGSSTLRMSTAESFPPIARMCSGVCFSWLCASMLDTLFSASIFTTWKTKPPTINSSVCAKTARVLMNHSTFGTQHSRSNCNHVDAQSLPVLQ